MKFRGPITWAVATLAVGATVGRGGEAQGSSVAPGPLARLDRAVPAEMSGGRRFLARSTAAIDPSPGEVIEIQLSDDTIGFPVSCNSATATYEIVDDVLHLGGNWLTTAMACSPQQDTEASRISAVLSAQPRFVIEGDVLTIRTPDASLTLFDADAPSPDDLPLIGTDWRIALLVDPTGGGRSMEGGTVRFAAGTAEVTIACTQRIVSTTILPDESRPTSETSAGMIRPQQAPSSAGPSATGPSAHSTTSTSPRPPAPTSTVMQTTVPVLCDPDSPSDWAMAVLDALTGQFSLEVDIDRARLRRADGTGIDLVALLA